MQRNIRMTQGAQEIFTTIKNTTLMLLFIFHLNGAIAAWFAIDGLHDRINPSDVGVVLGSKAETNGKPNQSEAAQRIADGWR
jgi:hypothetical protein